MNVHHVFDDIYKNELIPEIESHLKASQTLADRQTFGMPRAEITEEFKQELIKARNKINNLLTRLS